MEDERKELFEVGKRLFGNAPNLQSIIQNRGEVSDEQIERWIGSMNQYINDVREWGNDVYEHLNEAKNQ